MTEQALTLFADAEAVASGGRAEIAAAIAELLERDDPRTLLVFDDVTGEQVDIDRREASSAGAPAEAPERKGPGRPRLGVVSREVTLLPRHWEWLNAQPSGASAALRRLVDQARRQNERGDRVRRSREAAFRFMTAMAGNLVGFEEACRSLFAGDERGFESHLAAWPEDVARFSAKLAADAFDAEDAG
ncbi:DUF2239 family protein [Coriobacteriia bacterium Es71-Z0120]|uniref:DUF2239 family protein n=1 Tax=Parvivirga hydrogeniphila TaxID=2939460 RepID=UPI002260BF44|nr:DUF2239 family protein [Parvivirga hydrogeniphila]MCL4078428.1 DUF2239 family protein [Parvivirga hydrogeniphila]